MCAFIFTIAKVQRLTPVSVNRSMSKMPRASLATEGTRIGKVALPENLATDFRKGSTIDEQIDPTSWKENNPDNGQRRILSCDGGGMRGLIGSVILAQMEKDLQDHFNDPDYRLGHYFDVVGGTSTGSILATWVALGLKMEDCVKLYLSEEGAQMFSPSPLTKWPIVGGIFKALFTKYSPHKLEATIERYCGDAKMDSEDSRYLCDLVICAKDATTGETTFFNSNPESRNFAKTRDLYVKDLIRCSSAAPTFFPPKNMKIGDQDHEFIDGGVSYNNPSFPLFLEAVHPLNGFGFAAKEDKLLFMSVGTGYANTEVPYGKVSKYNALEWATYLISRIMEDSSNAQVSLMELIGYCPNKHEEGSIHWKAALPVFNRSESDGGDGIKNYCTYYRYGTEFTIERIKTLLDKLGPKKFEEMTNSLGGAKEAVTAVKAMDRSDDPYRNLLVAIGEGILAERYLPGQLTAFLSKTSNRPRELAGLTALER